MTSRDATGKSNQTKWGLVCDKLSAILANEHLTEDEHDAIAAAVNYLDECDGEHRHAKQSPSTAATPSLKRIDEAHSAFPKSSAEQGADHGEELGFKHRQYYQGQEECYICTLLRENSALRHDLERAMANHNDDLNAAPSSTAAKELAPLPDCMIGPSEPCEGYQRLQRELNAMRSATKETVNAPCDDKHECCCPDECQEAGECLVAMGVVRRPSSTRVKIK